MRISQIPVQLATVMIIIMFWTSSYIYPNSHYNGEVYVLYSHIPIHIHNTNICGNIINNHDSHAGILSPNWLQLQLELNWNSNWPKPSVAPGYIIVLRSPASCGHTHLHRIQPRPQVKVIFRYLRPDSPVSLFSCLFTQVHLLIDVSVEGQYVTY